MRKGSKKILFLCVLLLCCVCIGKDVRAQEKNKRVLFISSYSYGWDTVQIQIEGIKQGANEDVVLDYEFMDTKRVDDEESRKMFYEGLKYRMEHVDRYDAVILGDDAALRFAMEYQKELFDGIPLIFEGVNDKELAQTAGEDPYITGIVEELSLEKNIELGRMICPNATKVVMILDDSITGQAERKNFYSHDDEYPDLVFSEINTSELSTAALKGALQSLNEETILIYVVMTEDASGVQYTNRESIELIRKFSSVPALRMVEGGIGWGLLGGNIVSMEQSGEIAAQMAMDVINGRKKIEDLNVVMESPNIFCIDEQVMKEFEIDASVLPKDTVFVNHVPSFAERNAEALRWGGVLGAVLLAAVIFMLVDNLKKRKLTRELETARHYLEDASQHDFLTGLPNRSKFMADLDQMMTDKKPCTIIMMDVDNFKHINDSYGHAAGDEALKQVADRLHRLHTQLFTPYRFAGDEFIIIIRSNNRQIVEKSVVQCSQIFKKPFNLLGESHEISGSIGVATYPDDTLDKEQLIVCADDAMYEVKKRGKNAFVYYKDLKK